MDYHQAKMSVKIFLVSCGFFLCLLVDVSSETRTFSRGMFDATTIKCLAFFHVMTCFVVKSEIFVFDVPSDPQDLEFLVVTVATDETDGYKRFMRSCNAYNISVKVCRNLP